MVWNHRVIKRLTRTPDGEPEVIYGVYETFYNAKGEVTGFLAKPDGVSADSLEELEQTLRYYAEAFRHPVLDYDMECAPPDTDENVEAKAPPTDNL